MDGTRFAPIYEAPGSILVEQAIKSNSRKDPFVQYVKAVDQVQMPEDVMHESAADKFRLVKELRRASRIPKNFDGTAPPKLQLTAAAPRADTAEAGCQTEDVWPTSGQKRSWSDLATGIYAELGTPPDFLDRFLALKNVQIIKGFIFVALIIRSFTFRRSGRSSAKRSGRQPVDVSVGSEHRRDSLHVF